MNSMHFLITLSTLNLFTSRRSYHYIFYRKCNNLELELSNLWSGDGWLSKGWEVDVSAGERIGDEGNLAEINNIWISGSSDIERDNVSEINENSASSKIGSSCSKSLSIGSIKKGFSLSDNKERSSGVLVWSSDDR
jgi:hypothetical protein